jgi:hypothetical protein
MNYVLIVCSIGVIISMYVLIRNNKVFKFRVYIADLIYSRAYDMINDGASHRDVFGLWDMLDDISYEEMLYSFKPLKMECWFTDDELKSLGYERKDI